MTTTKQSSDAIKDILGKFSAESFQVLNKPAGQSKRDLVDIFDESCEAIEKLLLAVRIDELKSIFNWDCNHYDGRPFIWDGKDITYLNERVAELQSLLNKTGESE